MAKKPIIWQMIQRQKEYHANSNYAMSSQQVVKQQVAKAPEGLLWAT
jgi:hypothetical protein